MKTCEQALKYYTIAEKRRWKLKYWISMLHKLFYRNGQRVTLFTESCRRQWKLRFLTGNRAPMQ